MAAPEFLTAAEAGAIAPAELDLRRLPRHFYEDPYPTYRALLREAPVHRLPDGSVLLSRHADLERVYRDTATFSSDKTVEFKPKFGDGPLYAHHTTSLVFNDPPLHTRVRRIIAGALVPTVIAELEPGLHALVERLIGDMAAKGAVDLIDDFAAAIPIEIIGNLLGVPHLERGPLRDWSLAILGALEPSNDPRVLQLGNAAVEEFLDYLKILIAQRWEKPGDPRHDVLTRLIQGENDGAKLTEAELLHNCIFILNAGHETTTNLIGNALYLLDKWPGERARLIADQSLMKTAVEEFLRVESPNQLGNRRTTVPVDIGGETFPAGTGLTLCIGAANRDAAQFDDPDRLDVGRVKNRHLAFASGPHQCAGLALARLEGKVALGRFLARFPGYSLSGTPVRGGRARFRGFLSVPAELH